MTTSETESAPVTAQEVRDWLRECVAAHVRHPGAQIQDDVPLSQYGLDSVYVLGLCAEIEDHYGIEMDPALLWDHQCLGPLADAVFAMTTDSRGR